MQISRKTWKTAVGALCLFAGLTLAGCDQKSDAVSHNEKKEYDGLSLTAPLRTDPQARTVTMLVAINGRFLKEGTRHGIVYEGGSNNGKALFVGYAAPKALYDALVQLKATPGNNMTNSNRENTHVAGSKLQLTVNWAGAPGPYTFDEVLPDSNGRKIDMRFGGNLQDALARKTGCLVCMDSCPAAIVSNAVYTYGAIEKRDEVTFTGNASLLPADGTLATVTFKVVD
ncbi:TPA: YdjY domain-containing protein [Citrobacter freundii]